MPTSTAAGTGIFGDSCIFCEKVKKTNKDGTKQKPRKCLTTKADDKIKWAVGILAPNKKDDGVSAKISGIDFIAKKVQ